MVYYIFFWLLFYLAKGLGDLSKFPKIKENQGREEKGECSIQLVDLRR